MIELSPSEVELGDKLDGLWVPEVELADVTLD